MERKCVKNDDMIVSKHTRCWQVMQNMNICEHDYIITSNSLYLFNAVYEYYHALKSALNLTFQTGKQAKKQH
jgi:hypothetical protein